jgi:hypothetical protein
MLPFTELRKIVVIGNGNSKQFVTHRVSLARVRVRVAAGTHNHFVLGG